MSTYIHSIATRVPEHVYPQSFICEIMKAQLGTKRETTAILHRIYSQSGISKRHSVLPDLLPNIDDGILFRGGDTINWNPSTGSRNAVYSREARVLYTQTAQDVIQDSPFETADITHVITVSCTGFYAPGPDYTIVMDLGLALNTPRFHIGFMGCYAVFPALRLAKSICEAEPNSVVLIVSVELCTLHLRFSDTIDAILGASVFADGASAAIVSAKEPGDYASMVIDTMDTMLAPEGEADMAWTIGDNGFEMVLSSYVPKILEANIEATMTQLLGKVYLEKDDIDFWAVHPGGRAILDKIRDGMSIPESMLTESRSVLNKYGNLSSATILFVLKEYLDKSFNSISPLRGVAMAFGPGLTIESATLTLVPAHSMAVI